VSPALPVPAGLAISDFDSAAALTRALGRSLEGRDFPLLGVGPAMLEPVARGWATGLDRLPGPARQALYRLGGAGGALPPALLGGVRADALAGWVTDRYPRRRYPAVLVGASNGAAMHLAAALGVPWLAQTVMVPVRLTGDPDDPDAELARGREPGRQLLDANPELQLHHVHDQNQLRHIVGLMSYFRVKLRILPDAYRCFVDQHLEPGDTILVVDCTLDWPTTTVGDRHWFQHGAFGGIEPEAYQRRWGGPPPDDRSPESEWGYEPALDLDLEALGDRYRLRWLRFEHPEDLSPVVADVHRHWYGRLGRPTDRLLAESFVAVEPHWAQRTASVPYWMAFSIESSMTRLGRWLDHGDPYNEIRMTLFPHGEDSDGVARSEHWRAVLDRATKLSSLLGASEDRFPVDPRGLVRYRHHLARIRHRFDLPPPMALAEAEALLAELGPPHGVTMDDHSRRTVA
jgi:hypothetical protein